MRTHNPQQFRPQRTTGLWLALLTVAALLPFCNKAFHIDDPFYIAVARQIVAHPLDPYGISLNWFGTKMPVAATVRNPPLACYYLACAGLLLGWGEVSLHCAYLLPAVCAVLGTYRLAGRFCAFPALAAMIALFSPVFLVSGTGIMLDMQLLALFVWTVELWLRGLERRRAGTLFCAAVLMFCCFVVKYIGGLVLPLLFLYTLLREKRPGRWMVYFVLPPLLITAYLYLMQLQYGASPFASTAGFVQRLKASGQIHPVQLALTGLSFAGGGIAAFICFMPLVWSWRRLVGWCALYAAGLGALRFFAATALPGLPEMPWGTTAQLALFITAGLQILTATLADTAARRSLNSGLLLAWIGLVFAFTLLGNWTVNGRSILLMLPPVSIILVRRAEKMCAAAGASLRTRSLVPLCLLALLGGVVALADYRLANAQRKAALIVREATAAERTAVWFQGHWGFQYYMQQCSAKPYDQLRGDLRSGDVLVSPSNNTNVRALNPDLFSPMGTVVVQGLPWLSVMNVDRGAGFYASAGGPLPYIFGPSPPELFVLQRLR